MSSPHNQGADHATKPITERERQLLAMPTIASQLPVTFANGVSWTELTGNCNLCKKDIPADLLRGAVSRPFASVAVVEAVGACPSCRVATPFLYRLHDDRRVTGPSRRGWQTWRPEHSLRKQIQRWFRRITHI